MAAEAAAVVEAEAEYHDGRQARPLWLRARLAASTLELRRAGGEAVASWPVAALRVVDRAGGALRLAPDGSDARLLVSDAALVAALETAQRPRRRAALRRRLRLAALAVALVPAGGLALWKGWPPAADAIARAVPADWERSVGAAAAAALVGDKRVCDAPAGQAALDALAARLAAAGGVAAPGGLRVRVVDDPTVNALAAPGGEVIFFRGLVDKAGSAEELAGVLAHELAHVKHRHGLRGVARVAGLFVLTGALTGGSDAVAAAAVLVGLSYSREFEREADADGARMLHATGIGAEGLQAFFARLEGDGPGASGSLWDYVSTHPADADRIAALRAEARPADPAPAMSAEEWAAVRAICGAARKGEPKAGSAKSQPAAGRAARPRRRALGTFADWEAWTEERGGGTMCYAVAYPVPAPGERRSRKTMLWLAHRPWNRMNDISFETDVEPPPAGAAIRIEFGGRGAGLRMRRGAAWPHDTAALSAALRAAAAEGVAEATVSWSEAVKEDGEAPRRTHRFGLRGLVEAHAAIGKACEEEAHAPAAPATTAAAASAP